MDVQRDSKGTVAKHSMDAGDDVFVGGTTTSWSTVGGSIATTPTATMTMPASNVAAAHGTTLTGSDGVSAARAQQLFEGAAPVNEAERAWVQRVEQALASYVSIVTKLVNEGARQAQMGRDIYGRAISRGGEDHQFEQRVTDLVNAERARYGLQPLSYDSRMDLAAERHNLVQASTNTMAHDGIGDGTPGDRIRATGFRDAWGENVATGQLSPEQVVAEWMASPGHRRNILDPEYRRIGVSYTVAANGRTFWAQEFGA